MKQKKTCNNCINGLSIPVNDDVFCRKKGIVSPDYVCAHHRFQPDPKSFKELNFKCIHCEHFIADSNNMDTSFGTWGTCRLFSVRQYKGEEKNACSKFVKKSKALVP